MRSSYGIPCESNRPSQALRRSRDSRRQMSLMVDRLNGESKVIDGAASKVTVEAGSRGDPSQSSAAADRCRFEGVDGLRRRVA